MYTPTEKEVKNSYRILDLLSQIDGISYKQHENRADIFILHEEDTDLDCVLDVEEDIVVVSIRVAEFVGNFSLSLATKLLEMNYTAVHGAFTINNNCLDFRVNLEIENIDLNELQSAITSVFYTVHEALPVISSHYNRNL